MRRPKPGDPFLLTTEPHKLIIVPRTLSSNALEALQEFYSERDARAKQFEQLKVEAEEKGDATPDPFALESALKYPLSMETFGEDWNKSQFWVRRRRARPGLPPI